MIEAPWVVSLADGKYTMLCKRCGSRYTPGLPAPINMMTAMMNEFLKTHAECEEL